MRLELVVFDMAGTTVYDGDAVNVCLRAALDAAGFAVTRDDVNAVMGLPKPEAIRHLAMGRAGDRATISPALVAVIHEDFVARMIRHYREDPEVRPCDGAEALFARLHRAGVKIALDTGFSRDIADIILQRFGWARDGLVDVTVTSDEVPRGRPFPDMIRRAMELTGVGDVGHVAKVGDTPADLREGLAAGCTFVVGVTSGSHTREELLAFPHTHLIAHLSELAVVFGLPQS